MRPVQVSPELVDALSQRLPEMVAALEALVMSESPSADPAACESCASVADDLALGLLGRSGERVVVDGRTHLRWRFGEQTRVLLVGHLDTVWPIGTGRALAVRCYATTRLPGPASST